MLRSHKTKARLKWKNWTDFDPEFLKSLTHMNFGLVRAWSEKVFSGLVHTQPMNFKFRIYYVLMDEGTLINFFSPYQYDCVALK